jgi:tRNA/tmRNA/rRNA uracil-C5-methylase (TrmA/RlmC/RlmD family)
MVVSGSVERPLLGMLHRDGTPEDLTDCPLYPAEFAPVFAALKPFIARAGLTPYNVARKRGELKYLLLTESQQGGMMLRFVLRSEPSWPAARRAAVAAGAAAAAEGDYGEYSAGAYGDHGRRAGDLLHRTAGAGGGL